MDDSKMKTFISCLEHYLKCTFSIEEVMWKLEEQARCDLYFFSLNNDEEMVGGERHHGI